VTLNTKIKIKSGFLGPKIARIIWLSNLLTTNVSDEGYFKNVSCVLILISTF
jgi:hypothetical protein